MAKHACMFRDLTQLATQIGGSDKLTGAGSRLVEKKSIDGELDIIRICAEES